MNSFQIHNSEGQAIALSQLDREAATFWGKEVDDKKYAFPQVQKEGESSWDFICRSGNWFDIIGWNIAQQGNYTSGWTNVIHTMITELIGMKFITYPGKDDAITKVDFGILNEHSEEQFTIDFSDKTMVDVYATLKFYKPYINLINHWASKGYIPVQIKS